MTFEGIPIGDLSVSALLGIAVLLILLGRLKPKSDVDRADAAADKWRLAYEAEKEARAAADAQAAELLEVARTTHQIVVALFGATEGKRRSGGADVAISSKD